MLLTLKPHTLIALACFAAAKVFGLLSVIGLFLSGKNSNFNWVPVVSGSLWFSFLIASVVFSFISWRQLKYNTEREQYEKLKRKFENP